MSASWPQPDPARGLPGSRVGVLRQPGDGGGTGFHLFLSREDRAELGKVQSCPRARGHNSKAQTRGREGGCPELLPFRQVNKWC